MREAGAATGSTAPDTGEGGRAANPWPAPAHVRSGPFWSDSARDGCGSWPAVRAGSGGTRQPGSWQAAVRRLRLGAVSHLLQRDAGGVARTLTGCCSAATAGCPSCRRHHAPGGSAAGAHDVTSSRRASSARGASAAAAWRGVLAGPSIAVLVQQQGTTKGPPTFRRFVCQ